MNLEIPYPNHIRLFNLHLPLPTFAIDKNTFTHYQLKSTVSDLFDEFINDMGLNPNYENDKKWAEYFTFIESKSKELSISSN
jgi:hypothetical protein